MLNVKLSG